MQVVSGLVKHIPLEDMQGRSVVIVANLKPSNMRGIKSQAMVLAASSSDGQNVGFQFLRALEAPGTRRDHIDGALAEGTIPSRDQ